MRKPLVGRSAHHLAGHTAQRGNRSVGAQDGRGQRQLPSLNGCLAKIYRAHEHFEVFKAYLDAAANQPNPIRLEQRFDPDTRTIKITYGNVPDIPVSMALIAADAVQNLRAALNYLAWELAVWNLDRLGRTRDPDDATQFPINTKRRSFSEWRVRDLDPRHVARIQELQPNGTDHLVGLAGFDLRETDLEDIAARHPLAALAELTNEDKRRTLALGAFVGIPTGPTGPIQGVDCVIRGEHIPLPHEVYNGAEFASFDVVPTGPEPRVDMHPQITYAVVVGGQNFVRRYPWIEEAVTEIVREFEPVF